MLEKKNEYVWKSGFHRTQSLERWIHDMVMPLGFRNISVWNYSKKLLFRIVSFTVEMLSTGRVWKSRVTLDHKEHKECNEEEYPLLFLLDCQVLNFLPIFSRDALPCVHPQQSSEVKEQLFISNIVTTQLWLI